jgi:1,4-alpha-glucan branching enzyme
MRRLAVNRLLERPVDQARADRFVARHGSPIVEGSRATFLWVGEADEVLVRHRVQGLPDPLTMRRIPSTTLWYVSIDMPPESRVEYQFEVVRGDVREAYVNDPLNPRLAHGPFGTSSVCAATGYQVPDWTLPDAESRPGELVEDGLQSKALRRHVPFSVYVPARFVPLVTTRCSSSTTARTT